MNFICETLVYAKKNYYLCIRKAASRHNCSSKLGKFCSRFAFSLQKISGISAKQSSELVVLRSICIIFALCKRKSEARPRNPGRKSSFTYCNH